MFRRTLVIGFLAALILAVSPVGHAHAQTTPTIGIVDVEKILAEAKAAQGLQKQIQAKKESFQKEFSAKEKQLKQTETTLMAEKDKLSAEDFTKQRRAYEEKIMETRKLFQKSRSSLDQGLAKAMTELRKNIVEATAQVADEKNFDIVVTRESVLIADKTLDITDSVLAKLDAKVTNIPLTVQ